MSEDRVMFGLVIQELHKMKMRNQARRGADKWLEMCCVFSCLRVINSLDRFLPKKNFISFQAYSRNQIS